jgi:hypothetical protein
VQYQKLRPDKIVETVQRLHERIKTRFPGAGLCQVAAELLTVSSTAAGRATRIRRPNVALRLVVFLLLAGAVALAVWLARSVQLREDLSDARRLFEFVETTLSALFFLGAVIVFLLTLEGRLKRRRALAALHELRSIAHVIDMHQVAKDPERIHRGPNPNDAAKYTTKTLFDLNRYLNYCNELLAIVSKIAALYVQEYPDAATVSAVDQVEDLCAGLSQRIWQKVMVLEQFREQERPERSGALQPASPDSPTLTVTRPTQR